MLLLLATIMPKENEADIAVLVSRTERAQDGETMVALTVRDARKWRISSQAKLSGSEPHQNIAVQAEG